MNISNRPTSPPVVNHNMSSISSSSSLQQSIIGVKLFADNFWGEKINGFDVLCQNLKHSLANVKDLEIFLRECANSEDAYGKNLNKLVSQVNKFSSNGTFTPVWSPLKELNEKFAGSHVQLVHQLHELIKEIQRYNEDLAKKIKKIRENEIQTQNIVQSFQEMHQTLNKSKEQYHNLCIELEKQKRQLDPQQLAQYQQLSQQVSSSNLLSSTTGASNPASNQNLLGLPSSSNLLSGVAAQTNLNGNNLNSTVSGSVSVGTGPTPTDRLTSLASTITANKVSQVQKVEKKMKLALDDYKSSIEKYNLIRVEFERKLADSCNHFQYAEETHLKQMRSFIESYSKLISAINLNKQQVYNEFNLKLTEQFTVEYLLHTFIENKRTGTERPEPAQFIEQPDYAKQLASNVSFSQLNSTHQHISSPTPTHVNNSLINENDFNLIVNGNSNGLFANSSINTSTTASANQTDSIDSRGGVNGSDQFSLFGQSNTNNRGTPIFFNSSAYSQLTNSVSTNTLNSIPPASNTNGTSPTNNQSSQQQQGSTNQSITSPILNPSIANVANESIKRSDSKGLNIFNVDFLGRNKNKEKKAAQKAAAAAAAASETQSSTIKSKFSKINKKNNNKQNVPVTAVHLDTTTTALSISTNSNRDSSSINSEDSNETRNNLDSQATVTTPPVASKNSESNNPNTGSVTARSISSITGSLSFDLLDQLKLSNGSDIDSEGYSLRPDSSIDLRRRNKNGEGLKNKDNDDMNNFYGSSSTDSDSDDSDSETGDGTGPIKVMLKIKPKSEVSNEKPQNNNDVLREISKSLQLKPPGQALLGPKSGAVQKKRTYYYNYGTANPDQATSGWSTSTTTTPSSQTTETANANPIVNNPMPRSVSVGSVLETNNHNLLIPDLNFNLSQPQVTNGNTTTTTNSNSLLDLDLNYTSNSSVPPSMSLNKVVDNNLYNIDEDKEVESSFQYGQANKKPGQLNNIINSSSPANPAAPVPPPPLPPLSSSMNGRFTPACFPGRTTPDFRHSASLFEQGTRASIISPLTINGGSEIIPIAIAFNETIHAYFKIGDVSKFKVKCFGCMKISFPFAILKLLAIELPQLEFRLSNLQIMNQDLKINNRLLTRVQQDSTPSQQFENLMFQFVTPNLINELKQQHQQNKQAAFFNFELLKYEFKYTTSPLVLNANWSSNQEDNTVEFQLDYTHVFRKNLSQVNFMIIMPLNQAKITLVKSEPNALVQENDNKLQILWQMSSLNTNGRVMAKFLISKIDDSSVLPNLEHFYQPLYAKFHIDNETLSQVKFDILSPNYKLSLLKERVETGKYFCNYDQSQQQASTTTSTTASTPDSSSSEQPTLKKPAVGGLLSTQIGSTVDILLNY